MSTVRETAPTESCARKRSKHEAARAIRPTPNSAPSARNVRKISTARRAERAQRSDFGPPLHDRDRDGVVDEIHADQQRDVRERCEVELERAQHALISPVRTAVRSRARRGGMHARTAASSRGEARRIDDAIDAVEQADFAEHSCAVAMSTKTTLESTPGDPVGETAATRVAAPGDRRRVREIVEPRVQSIFLGDAARSRTHRAR